MLSAQRLTASMVSAHGNLFRVATQYQCVLNALRHQWFRHRHHPKITTYQRSAQRLTASMVSARKERSRGIPITCVAGNVLNALRHQWFRHDIPPKRRSVSPSVLNALRHQWFRHPQVTASESQYVRAQRLTASMVSAPVVSRDC